MDYFTFGYASFQFVVLLVVLGILAKNKGWSAHTNTAASILTVVGVLGTFIGIFIGLRAFNIDFSNFEEMKDSISQLLNGLKAAFVTSIVGIGSALLLKGIISPLVQKSQRKHNRDPEQENIDRFIDALKKAFTSVETPGEKNLSLKVETLTTTIENDRKTTQQILNGMRNDFVDLQGKVIEQLQTLKTTVSEEHNQLRKDRETTRNVLQDKILTQLKTLTNTVSNKNDLIIDSQKNEAMGIRKTLTDMQSELTDRQRKAFVQLRELTKTVSYEHNQLRKEFDNFSKNVAESITELATKELISSLTKVIEQFNTQLSTQFGDNFKQLNEAVGKTVQWQEQYRQQMDKLAEEFRIAANSIDNSRDSLKNIADSSSIIADRSSSVVTISKNLEPILHTLNDQLGAFTDLRQKANEAFPIIENRLDALTKKFSEVVQTAITDSQATTTQLKQQFDQCQKVINGLDDFTNEVDTLKTKVSATVGDLVANMNLQKNAVDQFMDSVTTMETTLEKQLTESIKALGTNLASLSEKFAEDYTPLTQSLREVLLIADGILPKQPGN